ncbi:hypothetical protein CHS0354_013514 [Potamilus streckersoni]|uniref:Chitin-binding type-2 domain-containing protein n=1 Tax=Potamilus streckersoni TaxID=2493646 RepID=A0AAE0W9T1_9BIVA|nr:hypothetical protein CHS0354_013514 [Potamilus streckersoni]
MHNKCSRSINGIKSIRALDLESCKLGVRTPDIRNCAKYYECTVSQGSQPILQAKECLYPLLFDKDSGKCVHYSDTTCDDRAAPKSPCEYDANQCRSSHCVPCHIRYPSCIGLPDGENFWAGREWTPYYIICHDERVVFTGECSTSDKTEIFNPDKKECAEFEDKIFG